MDKLLCISDFPKFRIYTLYNESLNIWSSVQGFIIYSVGPKFRVDRAQVIFGYENSYFFNENYYSIEIISTLTLIKFICTLFDAVGSILSLININLDFS